MRILFRWLIRVPAKHHFFGSLFIVGVVVVALGRQMTDRTSFANGELYKDVVDRWGAPIGQPAPSVRYVPSRSVFRELSALTLSSQTVVVDATMSFRKRGLAYFSGFDFEFSGDYGFENPTDAPIDVVFVFPFHADRTRTLLSGLELLVDGAPASGVIQHDDKLVWTGRLEQNESKSITITFSGRGLDLFRYELDPALRVENLDFRMTVKGGNNYDYPRGVVPATSQTILEDGLEMRWRYDSTESGVAVGLILPSERSFDPLIATMLRRSWVVFFAYFVGLVGLVAHFGRSRLEVFQSYLVAGAYGFFFVLLAYLGAFFDFWFAYGVAVLLVGGLVSFYLGRILGWRAAPYAALVVTATLFLPALAVALQGYTGLIYAMESLIALAALTFVTSSEGFARTLGRVVEV